MTDLNETLAAIRERAEAATDGPWVALGNDIAAEVKTCTCAGNIPGYGHEQYCGLDGPLITGAAPANAEFIAQARTDVPRLLATVEAVLKLHRKAPLYAHEDCCTNTDEEHREEHHLAIDGEYWCEAMIEDWTCAECRNIQEAGSPAETPEWPCDTVRALTEALEGDGDGDRGTF